MIDRNVLEWRLDPASAHRIPEITAHDQTVIVVCDEGYASSLAALSLQQLGLRNAHRSHRRLSGVESGGPSGHRTDTRVNVRTATKLSRAANTTYERVVDSGHEKAG